MKQAQEAFAIAQSTLEQLKPTLSLHSFRLSELHADINLQAIYELVLQNRRKYYLKLAPHLLEAKELEREIQVDERSLIFAVKAKDKLLGSLRLTSLPFELQDHEAHELDPIKYKNYLEIGRLVTDPDLDQISLAMLVRFMLCGAGLRAFEKERADGFVAICRPFRIQLFNKFGLQHKFDVFSNQRKMHYCFLSASQDEILKTTLELQENEGSFRKRLERLSQRV